LTEFQFNTAVACIAVIGGQRLQIATLSGLYGWEFNSKPVAREEKGLPLMDNYLCSFK